MGSLRIKPGVQLDRLGLAGSCIIGALVATAARLPYDLTITSGQDGTHSGPTDPHPRGNAIDVRAKDVPDVDRERIPMLVLSALCALERRLGANSIVEGKDGGFVSRAFYGFLEEPGTDQEHYHFQLRRGQVFPPMAEN